MSDSKKYDVCCSEKHHGMSYPSFSVVFIQTFSINPYMEFALTEDMVALNDGVQLPAMNADNLKKPILHMSRGIERQIFVLPDNKTEKKWWQRRCRLSPDNLYHFTMRGFDFSMNIKPEDTEDFHPVTFKGHAYVHADLFFSHTVSLTYRFRFDGCEAGVYSEGGEPDAAVTDHIISFLSTFLNAEYWSDSKSDADTVDTKINKETEFTIDNLWFDSDGNYVSEPQKMAIRNEGRGFDRVALRYKKYIYSHCVYKRGIDPISRMLHNRYRRNHPMTVDNDTHYAMVDIWEDVRHPGDYPDVPDYFAKSTGISEKEVIDHIRRWHKPELIGMMTLYPGEWVYRDPKAYDEVCGEDVSIDADDLVVAGSNVSVIIGTYGRREEDSDSAKTDWVSHLKNMRQDYQVSWQEYLIILQIVLAKKHVVGLAKEKLVEVSTSARGNTSLELIRKNAEMGMRLTRMVILLDLLKYSKFASHKVMFDRTTRRLGLDNDLKQLKDIMEMADNSLHNLSDYKSVRSDYILNIVLAVISVVSALGLLFNKLEMPFINAKESMKVFGRFTIDDVAIADSVMNVVALVVIAAIIFVAGWAVCKLFVFVNGLFRR